MEMKEILKQSLRDGVNQFIDSTINQLNEEEEPSFEECLEESVDTLSTIMGILSGMGAVRKFDKDYKRLKKDALWSYAMLQAVICKGACLEDYVVDLSDEEELQAFSDLQDLSIRWERAKDFLNNLKDVGYFQKDFASLIKEDLVEECNIFYDNISQLENWKGGIFSTRKLRKQISQYSFRLYSVCSGYMMCISFQNNSFLKGLSDELSNDD